MPRFWPLKKWQSRIFARLTTLESPRFLIRWAIQAFIRFYKIDPSTAEHGWETYPSLNAFFTRKLRPELRPIDPDPESVVSPVDARVQSCCVIEAGTLIQAKGVDYSLAHLIPSEFHRHFEGGQFLTLYLSPKDCHLIFSPLEGKVIGSFQIPGLLYQVREPYCTKVKGLYAVNERLATYLETPSGLVAVIKVGALNVARITCEYDATINTNQKGEKISEKFYEAPVAMLKGGHLATFNFGSTVILLFQKNRIQWLPNLGNHPLKYGEKIASILREPHG